MKTFKKSMGFAIACVLVVAVLLGVSSCGKKRGGTLLATYKGGDVYSSELLDWQNYFVYENMEELLKEEDISAALNARNDKTTEFYVQMKAFRQLLEDKGLLKLSDKGIKEYAEELIYAFNEEFKDNSKKVSGYEYWKSVYHVSDDFINSYAEYILVSEQTEKYVMGNYGVTDEMIKDYWERNAVNYLDVPSYVFEIIVVAVDPEKESDADEWARAKAEAEGYIARIKAGESFDSVKEDAIKNSKSPVIAQAYSRKDRISKTEAAVFTDLDAEIERITKSREDYAAENNIKVVDYADSNGDSKEWALWYAYCNTVNEATIKYVVPRLSIGETADEPIRAIMGYQIVRLEEITDNTAFVSPFEDVDVYNEIYGIIYAERWASGGGEAVDDFLAALTEEYDIKIVYSYYDEYIKAN